MTREQEIRERVEKATPEPMKRNRYEHGGGRMFVEGDREGHGRHLVLDAYDEANREFYFHAREDIPYLLAENQRLRDQLAGQVAPEELRQWKAEAERLREAYDKLLTSWAESCERHLAAKVCVEHWRSWARFTYLTGGQNGAGLSDVELQKAVEKVHDRDVARVQKEASRLQRLGEATYQRLKAAEGRLAESQASRFEAGRSGAVASSSDAEG